MHHTIILFQNYSIIVIAHQQVILVKYSKYVIGVEFHFIKCFDCWFNLDLDLTFNIYYICIIL